MVETVWGFVLFLIAGVCSALLIFVVYRAQYQECIYEYDRNRISGERMYNALLLKALRRAAHTMYGGGLTLIWGATFALLQWHTTFALLFATLGLLFAIFGYGLFNLNRTKLGLRGYSFPYIHLPTINWNFQLPWGNQLRFPKK